MKCDDKGHAQKWKLYTISSPHVDGTIPGEVVRLTTFSLNKKNVTQLREPARQLNLPRCFYEKKNLTLYSSIRLFQQRYQNCGCEVDSLDSGCEANS